MPEEIKVVHSESAKGFEEKVNALLKEGWELHGMPEFKKVSVQSTWNDRLRGWTEESYVQVLKRKR